MQINGKENSCRYTIFIKAIILSLLFGGSFAYTAEEHNYFRNPEFADNGRDWRITQHGEGSDIKVTGKAVDKTYQVDIAGRVKAGYIRLQQDSIELPADSECTLKFTIDAESDCGINWITLANTNGEFLYHQSHAIEKGKNELICCFFTPMAEENITANMSFQIGGLEGRNVFSSLSITAANKSNSVPYVVPEKWSVKVGETTREALVSGKRYNITEAFGPYREIPAVFESSFNSDKEGYMRVGFSADWFMEVYHNDKMVFSTREKGNQSVAYTQSDHPVNVWVKKGANQLKVNVWAGSKGWCFICGEPGEPIVFRSGEGYRPVDLDDLYIKPGSALDLSDWNIGHQGRVIVNKNGEIALEQTPDTPLKLYGFNSTGYLDGVNIKESDDDVFQSTVRDKIAAIRRQGYNYIRLWLNESVSFKSNAPFGLGPKSMERFDFLLEELRQNGIYINLAITGPVLFGTPAEWNTLRERIFANRMLMYLHDEQVENAWLYGLSLLDYVGPWSGNAIKDNPCIASIECYNEQYSGLALVKQIQRVYPADYARFKEAWNLYLCEKYGNEFASEPLPDEGSECFNDYALFCEQLVHDLNKWYVEQIRRIGYKGVIVQNNYKNLLFRSAAWQTMPALNDHTYYAYASNGTAPGSRVGSTSSIDTGINYMRELASGRFDGRPYHVGEYNHAFWNRYQYECGAVWGAYAAFQGFSGFNIHIGPVGKNLKSLTGWGYLGNVNVGINPVSRGGEFLNAHLFLRGDVKPSQRLVTLKYPNKALHSDGNAYQASSTKQSMLMLLSRYSLAFPDLPVPDGVSRGRKPDLSLAPAGLANVIDDGWSAEVVDTEDKGFSLPNAVAEMRRRGILPEDNITDAEHGVYQSDTGELTLRINEKQLIINTPRSEVFVSPAGNGVTINTLKVVNSTVNSCIGLVSRDGKPIEDSRQMVLVYTTRAANNEMRLSPNEEILLSPGYQPILLQTGKLTVELRNSSDRLVMYALKLNGKRIENVPLKRDNGIWIIEIDTSGLLEEPAVFYEITTDEARSTE